MPYRRTTLSKFIIEDQRRAGAPEDIAAMVAFFVGEEAGFVSGQVIYVAGGPKA